ncbi:DUF5602 domain-containing protein [Fibrisoma limi]|nr:DUF5602 domain-containing protein [Fibrisoma limi]
MATSLIILSTAFFYGCDRDNENTPGNQGVTRGPQVKVGNGTAQSFIKLDQSGKATSIGFTMTRGALDNLPQQGEHGAISYELPLPAEKQKTAYDHISLDWAPHGHMPNGVYNVPHFDMHFYMISQQQRAGIKPGTAEAEKLPDASFFPPNYASTPGEAEPAMGKHWVDLTSSELKGAPFKTTFIYGSYNGQVIFHEPMMAHKWLSTEPDTLITLSKPATTLNASAYPGAYTVRYDKASRVFTISLELTQKQ